MLSKRTPTAVAASALLLLSLAACAGGSGAGGDGSAGTGDGSTGSSESGGGTAACLTGKTWVLDLDDLASQLATQLGSSGMNVTQSEGEGRQVFEFTAAGEATAQVDVTYTITIVNDDLTLTLVQTHGGDSGGEWELANDGSTVTFANWDNNGYSVQNQMLINGVATENTMTMPSETLGGTDMTVDCSGSTLSTHVVSSPFTQHWSAEG